LNNSVVLFDTDCLSAFLWVSAEHILSSLYSGSIIVPQQVYDELSNPYTPQLKTRLDKLIINGDVVIRSILSDAAEFKHYMKLTSNPDEGHVIIGKGEAAVIALASALGGVVASNNLKDVAQYVSELKLQHITTGNILVKAFEQSLITESDGNNIWRSMLVKRRRIGAASFTDYIRTHSK